VSERIFVSFEETKRYFPETKTVVTGNPIRKEFFSCSKDRKEGDRFTILVFGGSAGAHRINQATVGALDFLEGVRCALRFIHQTGRDDFGSVSRSYQEKGFDACVRPFFENMADQYRASNLVICRAGASTLAELAACGRGAILIPYPYAAHQHQLINARRLADLGAALLIQDRELSGPRLAQSILELSSHSEKLRGMERAISRASRPRAAQEIVDHCYALVGGQ
jgi:UDP-N-acetylglucosamine--N-acetylmuramyl-(pentapeptide) pyrophosphoryl-undecaprenol N-acetylglucosamine transferase